MRYVQPITERFASNYALSFPVKYEGVGLIDSGGNLVNQPDDNIWLSVYVNTGDTINGTIGTIASRVKVEPFVFVVEIHMPRTTATSGTVFNKTDMDTIIQHIDGFMLFNKFKPTTDTIIYNDRSSPKNIIAPQPDVNDNWSSAFVSYNMEYRYV